MNKLEIAKTAYSFGDTEELKPYFSDNFMFTDSVGGQPMDKAGWFGMGDLMQAAMPDVQFVYEDVHEEGDEVVVTGRITGTFTNDFDLSAMGMGVAPATGEKVSFPNGTNRLSFVGDQISKVHSTDTGSDAGLAGMLAALGVQVG